MKGIFVDTSAWYTLVDSREPEHEAVVRFLRGNTIPLVTSNFVLDETLTLLKDRLGVRTAIEFGMKVRSSTLCTLHRITPELEDAAWEIFCRYTDKKWSFTDCTSFVLMKRLRLNEAFALDADFAQMGFQVRP